MNPSFPKIRHCLVCEDARLEKGDLLTLLGFYGVFPDFAILIKDLEIPFPRLTFVFIFGPGEGKFSLSFEIKDSNGKSIFPSPPPALPLELNTAKDQFGQFIMSLVNIKFPGNGKYQVQLSIDGKLHFQDTLEIRPFPN